MKRPTDKRPGRSSPLATTETKPGPLAVLNPFARHKQRRNRLIVWILSIGMAPGFTLLLYLSTVPTFLPDMENDAILTRALAADSSTSNLEQKQVLGQFFEGQAHLIEGQYALAAKNFERVIRVADIRPYFHEAAQWHLVVAYLKSGEPAKAARMYNQFVQCIDCDYPIRPVDRWKIWWQIKWAQWLDY